ncbi:DctP family TRAP transporter solute-binding subunit [Thermanaerosceptrum fracticalcis]|nr:DctP family TRAP transporter solute-binding subunit [Thermanaerosceptrum fracticalcis]
MMRILRKLGLFLLMALISIGLIAGCSGEKQQVSNQPKSSGGQEVVEIKLSHSSPAVDDRLEAACQAFKKYVEEKTNGKVKVTTYPASQLGAEREQLEGVQLGTIQMAALSSGPLPGIFPPIMVFDLPYLFATQKAAYEVLDGPVGREILDLMKAKTGIRGLVWGENGFRHYTNSVRPIRKPGDMQGLKIRTMENPAHMAIVKALGASPTPMAFNEVYTGLQQKTIDGQENPISLIVSMRFYEAQKYLTLDGHVYNPYILMINDKFYNSLSEDIRKIIDEGALVWQKVEREENNKQIMAGLEKLKAAGMEITELSPQELQAFRDATKSVYDTIGKKEVGEELLNKVLKAVQEAESKK